MTSPSVATPRRRRVVVVLAWAGVALLGIVIALLTLMVAATECFAESIVGFGASCPVTGYQTAWYATGGTVFVTGVVGFVRSLRRR